MTIETGAYYSMSPLTGAIRVCETFKNKPIKYRMSLHHATSGIIFDSDSYSTIDAAIAAASKYNFLIHSWKKEIKTT